MTVRERTEEIEHITLSPYASFSDESRGRERQEDACPMRTCYQRDRDRIIHCKAFRRLKQKTQVFLSPEGDHYRTRLTHTLEVSQIARTIARALRMNEDLTEAIALAHDLGHTPFGHAGERVLDRLCPGGFHHYEQSVRVVNRLEKDGKGLNLSWEVLNGIVTHTRGEWAQTREGQIVRYADRIAYMNHDIEDAVAAGVLRTDEIPAEISSLLGTTKSQRITSLITAMVEHGPQEIGMEAEYLAAYEALHDFMYSTVYVNETAKREEKKVEKLIEELYGYFHEKPADMPQSFLYIMWQEGVDRAVTDYISGMSDEYATRMFETLFVPKKWQIEL